MKAQHALRMYSELDIDSKEQFLTIRQNTKICNTLILTLVTFAVLLIFLARSILLTSIKKDYFLTLSDRNRIREFTLIPERGVIYDRQRNVLVRNQPSFLVELNTNLCSTSAICKNTVDQLQNYLTVDLDKSRLYKEIDNQHYSIIVTVGLDRDQILPIEANLNLLPGLSISTAPKRDYLYKEAFSHVLGYVGIGDGSSIVGKSGIEESYNSYLTGISGSKTMQINAKGDDFRVLAQKDSLPGRDVALYLDLNLQQKAYELLQQKITSGKALAGAVVAQDPRNGGILAMVSYPAFDPNKLSLGISFGDYSRLYNDPASPFMNRVIAASYPPGSVFKLVMASAILMEKVVGEYFQIDDPGFIQVGSYIFRNWKPEGHGFVDLRKALQVSNDTYFYTMGGGFGGIKGLGIKKIWDWATDFGYGSKTGIDIPGELSGFMPDGNYKDWYLGDTYITAIGQGDVLATPLQVNNITVYFANGGFLYRPQVVKGIDGVGELKKEVMRSALVSANAYEAVREGMVDAVEFGGTGYPLFDFAQRHNGIKLAGKTGTAEYIDKEGQLMTHAWFTVFGPYDNANIVLTVFLEGGGSGADDAAPIAKELLDLWFK